MNKLEKLKDYLKKIEEINYIIKMLEWEIDTMVPSSSFKFTSNIKSKYDLKLYELKTSKEYKILLDNAIGSKDYTKLSEIEKRYIYTLKDDYSKLKRIPKKFYIDFANLKNESLNAWVVAKEKNNYNIYKPYLKKIIKASKEYYRYMYPKSNNLYDNMLNEYEKGITSETIDKLFNELKSELLPKIQKLKTKIVKEIKKTYNSDTLLDLSHYLLEYIGFDNNKSTLGVFSHAFTTKFNSEEIRIALPKTGNIIDYMLTIIHEGGHGLFEQNIDNSLKDFNYYEINKNAVHESVARFYENILARNKNFWKPIYKNINKKLDSNISLNEYKKHLNNAHRSMIRTKADELTYPIHIIIRYELEKEVFNNNLNIEKLTNLWNQKYKEYLGVNIKNDKDGILQDMHWADASFGYFPSYLLGTIFDGMLLETLNEKLGNIDKLLKQGKVKEITKFLNNNIFKYGGTYNINELSNKICSRDLEINSLIKYFKKKY